MLQPASYQYLTTGSLIDRLLFLFILQLLGKEVRSFVTPTQNSRTTTIRHLFRDFQTVRKISDDTIEDTLLHAAEMARLSNILYGDTIELLDGHQLIAEGLVSDIAYMVCDRADDDGTTVRTIAIRGFHATDNRADVERLLTTICTASPEELDASKGLYAHSGLLSIARAIYDEIVDMIVKAGPSVKFNICGHSVGGSLSILLLSLLTLNLGSSFVREKVVRVNTFGSPPVMLLEKESNNRSTDHDSVLATLDLPSSLVQAYVQPWDPFVRLFSEMDPITPNFHDFGHDGVTPKNMKDPILSFFARQALSVWGGLSLFKEVFSSTKDRRYMAVGVHHVMLPSSGRYAVDTKLRSLLKAGIPSVPIMDDILTISSLELRPALQKRFPLRPSSVVTCQGILQPLLHHLPDAYDVPLGAFVKANKYATMAA